MIIIDKILAQLEEHKSNSALQYLLTAIQQNIEQQASAKVNFICTHNSRRSHIAQMTFELACQYYELHNISAYSGGTEATALNERIVFAAAKHGITLYTNAVGSQNPQYLLDHPFYRFKLPLFSKVYTHHINPSAAYIAVLVCDSAAESCPIVQGASSRIALPYKDPKVADDSPQELQHYMDKFIEIGTDMFWLVSKIKEKI